jgi:hypothetical protein
MKKDKAKTLRSVEKHRKQGLSVREACAMVQLPVATYYVWRKEAENKKPKKAAAKKKKENKKQFPPVVIYDQLRGIYFGYLVYHNEKLETAKLVGARHCYGFPVPSAGNKGVYSLATIGPGDGAKIGPRVTMTIHKVSKVVEATPQAVEAWEGASW